MTTPIYVNGIDGTTGAYLVPPLDRSELIDRIKEMETQPWLKRVADAVRSGVRGLPYDRDPTRVEQAGWGIVLREDEDPNVKAALQPLIDHREKQIGNSRIVKQLVYRDREERSEWFARYGIAPPTVDPEKVPYYLLIIGAPSAIPFRFSSQLSADYAVGRLDFERPEQFRAYAESVIAYETAPRVENEKRVVVFGPRHDPATRLSADSLLTPIANGNGGKGPLAKETSYAVTSHIGVEARKNVLLEVLSGRPSRPALLFTASHGMGWPKDHPRQEELQGALLCQDWRGAGAVSADDFFSASDLDANANVSGLIAFHFACFSAGTPDVDRFPSQRDRTPPAIAARPFTAALPKALLSHREGSALACVGHVERAWGYSIESEVAGPQLLAFENFIGRVLEGLPVGFAMRDFREKYAVLSIEVSDLLEQREYRTIDDDDLACKWVERNDAEAYLVFGDPAVHLRPEAMSAVAGVGGNHA